MSRIPHPTEVRYVDSTRRLHLTFSDDHELVAPTSFLRGFCPCARCQGHSGGPPKWNVLASSASYEIDDVTPVGNYGMCIVWADGHDTGIYAFEFLRSLVIPYDFDPELMNAGDLLDFEHP